MKILRSLIRPAALCLAGALSAEALTVKPNVGPVVSNQIANYDQFSDTTRVVDLSGFFSDPDASAAARMVTPLGAMNITLDGQTTPITVANFLSYVNQGHYFKTDPTNGALATTFFHRSISNFVIQGGGYLSTVSTNGSGDAVPTEVAPFPAIPNEPVISNRRGTIAMAQAGADANSATCQWFINLVDNSGSLDIRSNNAGPYTVFGRVAGNGMTVADAIAALPKFNLGGPFTSLPLRDYTSPNRIKVPNLVTIPEFTQISPLNFAATTSNQNAALVTVSGTKLLVDARQIGTSLITVTATDLDGAQVSQSFTVNVTAAPGRLRNISTRANIGTDDKVLIAGFIVGGGTSKRLAVRGIGPSLKSVLPNAMDDPSLQLFDGTGAVIASNDNWADAPNKQDLIDIHLAPTSDKEAAILTTVPSSAGNQAYTAIVRGVGNTSGIGLVEVYDLDSGTGATILNLSSRANVGTGGDVMIGGVIVSGDNSKRIVVRALGPSLTAQGVSGALPNPTLGLYNAQGTLIDSNDDWQTNPNAAEIQADTLAPSQPTESAVIDTVQPGAYTAIVSGVGATPTGVAIVEVYQVPN